MFFCSLPYAAITPEKTVVEDSGTTKIIVTMCDELTILLLLKMVTLKMGMRPAITHSQLLFSKRLWSIRKAKKQQ